MAKSKPKAEKVPLLIGIPQASDEIGVDQKFVRRGIEAGVIPHTKVGRLFKVPLWWIEQQRNGPKAGG